MTGKQHLAIGIGVSCATLSLTIIGGAIVGSIFPDIDSRESIISRYLPVQKITGGFFMKHRGGIHSLLSCIIFGVITYCITKNTLFAIGFMLGYLSHLFSDMLTHMGVPLFFPKKKRYRFLPRGLGEAESYGVAYLVLFIGVYFVLKRIGWL